MNRHHPYGGGYDGPPNRRGGHPGGPDRPHRWQDRGGGNHRGRGNRGRGDGNYGSGHNYYDGNYNNAYDQPPPQGDIYSSGSQENTFYQNDYGNGSSSSYSNGPNNYNQGFGDYEDGPDSKFTADDGYGDRTRRPIRKEKDDKVHDSIIEERIQRERPCRTLFIRNIKYETNSEDVRRQFEEHGEIKTFFDLISTRGMVFVTYYDLRAAERARERLQGSEISGRPIDVHYSLPRDDQKGDKEKNQQFQGMLQVTLRNSPSGQHIDDNEVRRKFQQFGDVKSVSPVGDRTDSRYVEFYDTRACDDAFDRLRHQSLQDGVMEIVFAWDTNDNSASGGGGGPRGQFDGNRDWDDGQRGGHRGRGRGRGRGGRGRGGGGGGGVGGGYDDYDDRRDSFGRDRDRPKGRWGGGGGGDEFGSRGGRGGGGMGFNDRYDSRPGPPPGPPSMGGYGGPPGPPSGYNAPPPPPPAAPSDDRLEQARKVQQLLAALKQPAQANGPPAPPMPGPPPAALPPPGVPPHAVPPAGSFYPPPPAPYMGAMPPSNPYGALPPAVHAPSPGQPSTSTPSLPPNIMALLQQAQHAPGPTPPPAPPGAPGPPSYGLPPPPMAGGPPPPPGGGQSYQQLMAYLQSQKRS